MFAEEEYIDNIHFKLYYNDKVGVEVGLQRGCSIEPYMWLDVKDDEIVVWWEYGGELKTWVFRGSEYHKAEKLFELLVKKAEEICKGVRK